jgi:hypothetical protein
MTLIENRTNNRLFVTIAAGFLLLLSTAAALPLRPAAGESSPSGQSLLFLPFIGKASLPLYPPGGDDWFAYLNYYRALASLPPVSENAGWSSGNWQHAQYSVKNNQIQHFENPGNPWYTPEGNQAAQSSNLFASFNTNEDDQSAIGWWVSGPFHAVGLLNPQLLETGYGSYREEDGGLTMAAGLDVIRGVGGVPASVSFPIRWPGNGAMVYLTQHTAEIPDALTSCPGYSHPAGLPILLQLGTGSITPQAVSTSLLRDGIPVEHCTFNETSYTNPNPQHQSLGRGLLNGRDALVILPRNPLVPGASYSVSFTVNGATHAWIFSVAESAAGPGLSDAISH